MFSLDPYFLLFPVVVRVLLPLFDAAVLNPMMLKGKEASRILRNRISDLLNKENKELQSKIRKLETKVKNAERKITELEKKLAHKTTELESTDYSDTNKYEQVLKDYNGIKSELDTVESNWEAAEMELEELMS